MGSCEIAHVVDAVGGALARSGIHPHSLVLIALSGGPDSVALTNALHSLRGRFGYRLAAAHLNHGLRGNESDRDERFVRDLCERLQIELWSERAAGLGFDSPNLEEKAREMRYSFFRRVADNIGADFIALAHTADDQAETVMMRLVRGAGAEGLSAMAEAGPDRLIRPMLSVGRDEILAYLSAIEADYVTDSSNFSRSFMRNRVRHELLPVIERDYAKGIRPRLVGLANEMRDLHDFIRQSARAELMRRKSGNRLDLDGFEGLHPALARALLREFVREHTGSLRRIGRVHVDAMIHACSGESPHGIVALPGGFALRREYSSAVIDRAENTARQKSAFALYLPLEGELVLPQAKVGFDSRIINRNDMGFMSGCWKTAGRDEAYFDSEKVGRLRVRNFRHADRISLAGIGSGHKKVHDVFVDCKVPRARRMNWPLVVAQNDEVIWIPMLARSGVAMVTTATSRVIHLAARPLAAVQDLALPGNLPPC